MNKEKALPALRWGLLALAIVFICAGLLNREYQEVLGKAVRICLECIGIG